MAIAAVVLSIITALVVIDIVQIHRTHDVTISVSTSISEGDINSAPMQSLTRRYSAIAGDHITRSEGYVVFMSGTWKMTGKPSTACQVQLAIHNPSSWQLFSWTGDHGLVNGTINSWGTIVSQHAYLRDYPTLITLPVTASGTFMIAWQPPSYATQTSTVTAKAYFACGSKDTHSRYFSVQIGK